jgi:outer membrane immunogenic protein
MKRRSLAIVSALMFAAPAAQAADMALKAPPPVAPAWTWTGFYVGLNLGGAWGNSSYTLLPDAVWATTPPPNAQTQLTGDGLATLHMSSVSAGGQVGYNWQVHNVLFGGEADIQYIGLHKTNVFTQNGPLGVNIVTPYIITESSRSDWMATIRGRLGLVAGRVLFYGTGGVAFADSQSADTLNFPTLLPAATFTGTGARSSVQTGWTAGGGVEWAFNDHWTAKAEYLYARFPTSTTRMTAINAGLFNTGVTQAYSDRLAVNLARLGLNYKF